VGGDGGRDGGACRKGGEFCFEELCVGGTELDYIVSRAVSMGMLLTLRREEA
jgi:hypothetical protein